jgi:hypothetical protein
MQEVTENKSIRTTEKKHPQTSNNENTQHTEQGRIIKAAKGKRQVTYKGKPIRKTTDSSTPTLN